MTDLDRVIDLIKRIGSLDANSAVSIWGKWVTMVDGVLPELPALLDELQRLRSAQSGASCLHEIRQQGDIVVFPFDTPSGRISITWCRRCGAIHDSMKDGWALSDRPADTQHHETWANELAEEQRQNQMDKLLRENAALENGQRLILDRIADLEQERDGLRRQLGLAPLATKLDSSFYEWARGVRAPDTSMLAVESSGGRTWTPEED